MAVFCDPGRAPLPLWASLLGNPEVMENGFNIRMATKGLHLLAFSPSSSSSASDSGLPATFLIPLLAR